MPFLDDQGLCKEADKWRSSHTSKGSHEWGSVMFHIEAGNRGEEVVSLEC